MQRHPRVAPGPEINEGAGHRHKKHDDRDDSDRNCHGVASRRRHLRTATPAAFVAIIPAGWRILPSTPTDVFDDEFDVFDDSCAWHASLLVLLRSRFSCLLHLRRALRNSGCYILERELCCPT